MRTLLKTALLPLWLSLMASATALANPINVGDTGVTFTPPPTFQPLPQHIIDRKWPSKTAPRYVVGNERATTTVAYDLKPHKIPQDKLDEAQKVFTALFGKIVPIIAWKRNEIIEHEGQKWLFMEMTSEALDTDIYNMLLVTGFDGQMLVFNFNSTKEEFPKYEQMLRDSIKSIRLPK